MLQITDYCPQGVAVVHDELRGMGLSGVQEFRDEGAVSGGCGLKRWWLYGRFDALGGKDF